MSFSRTFRLHSRFAMLTGAAFLALMLSADALPAAVILSDTFSYPDGPITNAVASPWITHSSNDANEEVLVVSGKAQLSFARGDDVHASLTNQPYTTGGGAVLYTSFTVQFSALPTSAGSYFAHFNPTSNHRARVWASTQNAPGGFFRLGIGNSTGASAASGQLTNNLALNTTHTVVTRYNVTTGASTIWLNPGAESDFGVTATDTPGPVSITTCSFRQSTGMGTLAVDDLKVGTAFSDVVSTVPPAITTQPQSQTVTEGATASFTVVATGSPPLSYQWRFNTTNLAGATSPALTLTNVTAAQAGTYTVTVTNLAGATNSQAATLTVNPSPPPGVAGFSLVTYNTHGNLIADWSTNSPQVRAIGRQLSHLNPDIVTFQEIAYTNTHQMVHFVAAFLPGYNLATNSGTDGFIRSVIASRFPITRSQKWLDGADLNPFGYTNANFTRDLFEAQIRVPGFPQPLHVFTTHLKSGQGTDDSNRRAAEASAISNFFANGFLTTNSLRPYLLTGDLNEDIARPPSSNPQSIQRLANAPTGLRLTTPLNPVTASELTFDIRNTLTRRYDYILPCGLLFSNIAGSQVFRTDLLTNPPPPLLTNDSVTASDHLPVVMAFNNPYDKPFRLLSITRTNASVTLTWQAVPGQPYRVDSAANLTAWSTLTSNLVATGTSLTFTTNVTGQIRFFRIVRLD